MNFYKTSILFLTITLSLQTYSQTYTLPKLQYAYNALEPSIDSTTMEIHYTKHHQTYINNLNKAIKGTHADSVSITDLFLNISSYSEVVRNNAGGHYNHSLFWEILTPKTKTKPSPELLKAIESTFTSMDSLQKLMNKAASTRFGSGWAWLIVTPDKKLAVCSTPNQDNTLMNVVKEQGIPIIAIDVWEHAYYLKYQYKRGDYLGAIWNIMDWGTISKKYAEALNDPLLKVLKAQK